MTPLPTLGIITPTIGASTLLACLQSVAAQTIPVVHYLVIDGEQAGDAVHRQLNRLPDTSHLRQIFLQENVGKGFYGHRVYASVPALCHTDYICYLDSDNTISPTHAESLLQRIQTTQQVVSSVETSHVWAYSLRSIMSEEGTVLCEDDCESLGQWPAYGPPETPYYHIDTSCYCLPRGLAISCGPAWYGGWGQDRVFFRHLQQRSARYACTGLSTVHYRLGGNEGSVRLDYFHAGNAAMRAHYGTQFPWRRP